MVNNKVGGSHPLRQKSSPRRSDNSSYNAFSDRGPSDLSPLRQKSPVPNTGFNTIIKEIDLSSRRMRQSNKEMRELCYRKIKLCQKGLLNYYESSTFVGFLLDIIYMSRKLE